MRIVEVKQVLEAHPVFKTEETVRRLCREWNVRRWTKWKPWGIDLDDFNAKAKLHAD